MISSFHSFDTFRYGYMEVRAILPSCGHGHRPALWLLHQGAKWPPEIDFGETAEDGLTYAQHSTLHPGSGAGGHLKLTTACDGRSHTYGVLVPPSGPITWYFDRKQVAALAPDPGVAGAPYFLIISLAIAPSNFAGELDAKTLPASMIVQGWTAYALAR